MTSSHSQAYFLDGPKLAPNVTRFWLVRHGIVEASARDNMYGTLDVPLCPYAQEEQKNAYFSLSKTLPKTDLWFSSPLKRAYDTGMNIQKAGGFSCPIRIKDAFLEQSLGAWNGTEHKEFHKNLFHKPPAFWPLAAHEVPPEGETMTEVKERVGQGLEALALSYKQQDMIILSHGGAIRMALAHALGIEAENALHFTIQNLSYSILEKIGRHWRVVSVNVLPDF